MTSTDSATSGPRPPAVVPSGTERRLAPDDVIISETDTKGIITSANATFARLAAYTEGELLGQPHNLVRHPDMPRCVFKLLWDTIAAGEDLHAYVLNLAGDGAHYWVFAHVYPIKDLDGTITGYRSERRAPNPAAVETMAGLYAELLRTERSAPSAREGLEASTAQLGSVLAERGQSYPEFIRSIT